MALLKRQAPATLPIKVLQFGEGNFLRAFIDWMINEMNKQGKFNGMVRMIQPLEKGMAQAIDDQDGLYTLILRGVENGKVIEKREVINSVKDCLNPYHQWQDVMDSFRQESVRFVFSNTTEAGIEYKEEPYTPGQCQHTYPAKMTALLYERFKAGCKGLNIIPCELIDKNGITLRKCILQYIALWNLPTDFKHWIENDNTFYNTLVDRIVAGYPKNEAADLEHQLGYEDKIIDCGEVFHFFVIEGPQTLEQELPLQAAGLHAMITDNQTPYRTRKVRFLNGAHTGNVLAAILGGLTYVDEMMKDNLFGKIVRKSINDEIYHTVELPEQEKRFFADSVIERFENPFAMHRLLSISLNSVSKWKVRVLPSLLDFVNLKHELPKCLAFSLVALIRFYEITLRDGQAEGHVDGRDYPVSDSPDVLQFFADLTPELQGDHPQHALDSILANRDFWGMDLREVDGLQDFVRETFKLVQEQGIRTAAATLLK